MSRRTAGRREVPSLHIVRRLVAYNKSVFGRFQRSLERQSWKFATANRGTGHLSLKNTLVHILNVHEAWMVGVVQRRWEIFDRPDRRHGNIRSWAELRKYRDRVWNEIDRLLSELSDRKLGQRVKAPWMPGQYTLEDAFFQTTVEQAHHLGEIIAVYWQHNKTPPDMTWIENLPDRAQRR